MGLQQLPHFSIFANILSAHALAAVIPFVEKSNTNVPCVPIIRSFFCSSPYSLSHCLYISTAILMQSLGSEYVLSSFGNRGVRISGPAFFLPVTHNSTYKQPSKKSLCLVINTPIRNSFKFI